MRPACFDNSCDSSQNDKMGEKKRQLQDIVRNENVQAFTEALGELNEGELDLDAISSAFQAIFVCNNAEAFDVFNEWCRSRLGYHDDIRLPLHQYLENSPQLIERALGNSKVLPSSWYDFLKTDLEKSDGMFVSKFQQICAESDIHDSLSEEQLKDLIKTADQQGKDEASEVFTEMLDQA